MKANYIKTKQGLGVRVIESMSISQVYCLKQILKKVVVFRDNVLSCTIHVILTNMSFKS